MLDGIINLLGGIIGAKARKDETDSVNQTNKEIAESTNQANMDIAKMNIDYQNQFNADTWAREDNAHQREVNDLMNAGLSPLLATAGATSGGGATAQNTATMEGYNAEKSDASGMVLQGMQGLAESVYNDALMRERAEQSKIDTDMKMLELQEKAEQFERSQGETERHNRESEQTAKDNINWKNNLVNALKDKVGSYVNDPTQDLEEKVDDAIVDGVKDVGDDLLKYKNEAKEHWEKGEYGKAVLKGARSYLSFTPYGTAKRIAKRFVSKKKK